MTGRSIDADYRKSTPRMAIEAIPQSLRQP
jgi:hypothetical protein